MSKKVQPPNKDWLAVEWLLPPRGKGRGSPKIAAELGVSKKTVLRWLKDYGITESSSVRTSSHRTGVQTWSKEKPDKTELAALYLMPPDGEGWTLAKLSKHYQVTVTTLRKWLKVYDLTQPFVGRQKARMSGEGNPAYINGTSLNYHKNALRRTGNPPDFCEWCNATEDIQIHHKDHDRKNGDIDNLMWLCGSCNRLESHIWALQKKGLVEVMIGVGKIEIKFLNK